MGQNKTKSRAGKQKQQLEKRAIYSECPADRGLTVLDITVQRNHFCQKTVSTHIVKRRHSEAGLYYRIVVKKPQLKKQNNIKMPQKAKGHKEEQ